MEQKTKELQDRYDELMVRNEKLSGGEGKVTVELPYNWDWSDGDRANTWFEESSDVEEILERIGLELQDKIDAEIKKLFDDVDAFVADGGEWDEWEV